MSRGEYSAEDLAKFARLIAEGEGYRRAFAAVWPLRAAVIKPSSAEMAALRLSRRPDVAEMISGIPALAIPRKGKDVRDGIAANEKAAKRQEELVAAARQEAMTMRYEIDEAMADAHAAFVLARDKGQAAAMVAAASLKAKLHGLLVEDRGNARRKYESLTDEQLQAELDRALEEAGKPAITH